MDRAIIFDVGGVLLDYERDGMLRQIADGCRTHASPADISNLIAALDLSLGINTMREFDADLRAKFGYAESYERLCKLWVEGLSQRLWTNEYLQSLQRRADLYILSDTNAEHWLHIEQNILELDGFRRIFLSHELKMTKKDGTQIFTHVLDQMPHVASSCLFIDDTAANVEYAAQVGLQTHIYEDQKGMAHRIELFLGS